MNESQTLEHGPAKPPWLKVPFPGGKRYNWIRERSSTLKLSTVCEEAHCPNIGECWNSGTATFMLMGDTCTRGCRFCAVNSARFPAALDEREPDRLAETISTMNLRYAVLTTVDRDDLPDQGAEHIARCIQTVQLRSPDLLIEILMPDFCGETGLLRKVIDSRPAVLAHNLETVHRLTEKVRDPRAGYDQSLEVLRFLGQHGKGTYTKSSLMLGLGETRDETLGAMQDLRRAGVDFLTLGQYLQPTRRHLRVEQYLDPELFKELAGEGEAMGFEYVAAGPLVRSSYRAAEYYIERKIRGGG